MKPHIVYLVTEDWYFWSHRLELAEAAKREGFEVTVITRAGSFAGRLRDRGFAFYPLNLHRSAGSLLHETGTIIRLARLYRRIKPDLVHHVGMKAIFSGSVAARLAGVPAVINAFTGLGHVFVSDSLLSRFARSVLLPVLSVVLKEDRFHAILQNTDDRDLLLKYRLVNREQVSLIRGSGVNPRKYPYRPESACGQPIVLFASRLLRDKGILEFIEAARILKDRGVPARFVLAGDTDKDNPSTVSEQQAGDWVEQGLVEWWGYRKDMPEVFAQVHIVCLPSLREGLPKVLLEAAACGRAVIATDVPGCREVVQHNINGLLVPVRDYCALADAIEGLLVSPERRKQMGEEGRKRVVENFSVDMINEATIALYSGLLSRHGIRPQHLRGK